MEIVEIISSYISKESNIIRVEFKFMGDEGIRQDVIEFQYMKDFGYYDDYMMDVFDSTDFDSEGWEDWEENENEIYSDDENLISFLNEYYIVFPDRIPDEEYS